MNCTKKYKNKMGGLGIADNPRNYYRVYFGVRNRKWWWYILFWHTLSTYAFITCMVLQENIDYLIMIKKGNIMCMNKSGK